VPLADLTTLAARHMAFWMRVILGLAGLKIAAGLIGAVLEPVPVGPAGSLFAPWIPVAVAVSFSSVGVLLLWTGSSDARAMHLGAVFMLVATMFAERFLRPFTSGPGAAADLVALLSIVDPVAFRPYFVWRFAAAFPREPPFGWPRRAAAIALRVTHAGGWLFFAGSLGAAAATLAGVQDGPSWLNALDRRAEAAPYFLFLTPLTLAALLMIAVNTRAAGPVERRRVRVFVGGLVIGTGPVLIEVLLELLVPPFAAFMSDPEVRRTTGLIVYPLLVSTPVSTGYAVLVDQVLSIRLVVRAAIRYALARATILAICAVPFLVLLWMVWIAREGGAAALFTEGRVLALSAPLAGGLVLLRYRRSLRMAVDRQFFRDQYDARAILGALVQESRSVHSLPELASRLTQEIDRALHVERIALLVPDPATDRFVALDGAVEALPSDAPLLTLVAGRSDPMDVRLEQPSSIVARLPERDRQWLADGGFQLLVPMLGGGGVLVGLISIGAKRSELPFSNEDRWLLSAIASSGALAIENLQLRSPDVVWLDPGQPGPAPPVFGPSDLPADECASCGVVLPPRASSSCPTCGGQVRPAPIPLIVRGTFQIDRLLGRGGMGVVYRAFDVPLGRVVAVKTLPAVSPERAQQLRREAKAMAAVSHPNLATIFAIELWRGTPMLIVEYFESTLYDRLRRGPLAPPDAVRIIGEVAEGLEALHGAGILHRDVKPSNIGLTAGASAKLLDFGLAKMVRHTRAAVVGDHDALQSTATAPPAPVEPADPVSAPHQMIGTALYMSPETLLLRAPDASVDLWALALVLYESLAGVHPMRAATAIETMSRIAKARVPDIREHWADCPPPLAAFLEQALHADRRKRPGTAREFRSSLERTCAAAVTA
jgi:hypothetical protein